MNLIKNSKKDFPLIVILLIPVAVAINMVGAQMTNLLKLPIDLDMIGVILVGLLAGAIPAAVTGILTNLVNGIFDPTWIPYAITSCCIGLTVGALAKHKMVSNPFKMIISGLIIALVATLTATPITVFLFGGSTGGGSSMLAAGFMAAGKEIITSVFSVYIVTETIGKLISIVVAYIIIKAIPDRSLTKYKYGMNYVNQNKY